MTKEKTKKLFIVLSVVFTLWALFVFCSYFFQISRTSNQCSLSHACVSIANHNYKIDYRSSHKYYLDSFLTSIGHGTNASRTPGPILFIIGGVFFLFVANLIYEAVIEKKKKLEIKLTPFEFFVLFTFLFFLVYNRWVSYFGYDAPIKYSSIFYKYAAFLSQLFVIILFILMIGKKIKDALFENNKDQILELIYSYGLGSAFIALFSYFLALFNVFNIKYLIILSILVLLICFKNLIYWLKKVFIEKIEFTAKFFDPFVFLFLFLLIIIVHNLLELIRPIPVGFDDMGVYMNNAKLMAGYGHLISGAMSYYWELFTATGIVMFKNMTVAMMLSFSAGIFSIFAVYYFIKTYLKKRGLEPILVRNYSLLGAVIFYSLPSIFFQSSNDMKVDIIGLYFSLLGFIAFWQWKDSYLGQRAEISNGSYRFLILSALFIGFSIAIKYTNLLFLFVMFLYLIYIVFTKYKFNIKKYLICLFFVLIAFIPLMPISIRNIYQTKSFSVYNIRFGSSENQKIILDPPFSSDLVGAESNFDKYMKERRTGDREEVLRYIGYEKGVKKYLLLPFRATNNTLTNGLYVDIGYLFLIFVPICFFYYLTLTKNKKEENKIFKEIFIFSSIFWILWIFSASGIIWYGYSGFIFLLILLIEGLFLVSRTRYLKYISYILILIWLTSVLFLKSTVLPSYNIVVDPENFRFARGEIDEKTLIDEMFNPYIKVMRAISEDIDQNPQNPPKVYRVGTFYKYFISKNDKTVLDDQMLDKFTFAYQDRDDQKMLERLQNNNIKYLIVDKNMVNVDVTPEKSFVKKYNDFMSFLMRNSNNFILLSDRTDEKTLILEFSK